MVPAQKQAWFNLAVIAVALAVVLAIVPFNGRAALGGFGFLGLLGFGGLFFRKKPGRVLTDERDNLIRQRSVLIGYTVFWVAFILAATVAPVVYPEAVPAVLVTASAYGGVALFLGVMSVATLVQYARGGGDGE